MTHKFNSGFLKRPLKYISNLVYSHMEKGSGSMILLTGITAIVLSMLAQTGAILTNKKYSASQKAFMIPQELAEGCITALSMFFITKPVQRIGDMYVKRGKVLTKDMQAYLKKYNLLEKRGKADFNLEKSVNNIINKIEKSDIYKKSDNRIQNVMIKEHNKMLSDYNSVYDTTSAIATTAGGIISTAFVSPLLRNYTASNLQKKNMEIYNNYHNSSQKTHAGNLKIN